MLDIQIDEPDYKYSIAVVGALEYKNQISGVVAWLEKGEENDLEKFDIVIDASKEKEICIRVNHHIKRLEHEASIRVNDEDRKIYIEQFVKLAIDQQQMIGLDLFDCMMVLTGCQNFATKVFDRADIMENIDTFIISCNMNAEKDVLVFVDGELLLCQFTECMYKIIEVGKFNGQFNMGCNGIALDDFDKIRISLWYCKSII